MSETVQGHHDPEVSRAIVEVKEMLRAVFQTRNEMTLAVTGTGSAAMEAAIVNLAERGERVVIAVNGQFGERLATVAERAGVVVERVDVPWGEPVLPDAVEAVLQRAGRTKVVAMVHGETSTGILNPVPAVSEVTHRHGALFVLDTVSSLGGVEVDVDGWDVDVCYSATQKCIGAIPGLGPITVSPRGVEAIRRRKTKPGSYFFDLVLLSSFWTPPSAYHHTFPVTLLYALREGLRMIMEEGLERRYARHASAAAALRAGLQAMGLRIYGNPGYRFDPLTAVVVPEGVDEKRLRSDLLLEHGIEISGGVGKLAGKVVRIGLMADSCHHSNVLACLSALERCLAAQGYEAPPGAGVAAAQKARLG
jgi:alanine-glyoxylate transaminase/serine-glyoxylate transaminase/serine-pyruvate transaminase